MKQGSKKQFAEKSPHPFDALLQGTPEDSKSMIALLAKRKLGVVRDKEHNWFCSGSA
jgi:hypothetical protein